MRSRARLALATVLASGTVALAFFSGGYFAEARLWAALAAWALLVACALTPGPVLPRARSARLSLLGLVMLAAWTAISIAWAPLKGPALEDFQRLLLYVAAFATAAFAFRDRRAARALEPALAAGIVMVVCEGLSERVLPSLFELQRSVSAGGRLDQPLTYWNAMGALAAIGFVLAARIAGDEQRHWALRAAAAASTPVLGAGVYLSFSRGAIAALVVGLVALIALVPARPQLRTLAVVLVAGLVASVVSGALSSVRTLGGSLHTREIEGAAMLAVLAGLAVLAALTQGLLARREHAGRLGVQRLAIPRRAPLYAAVGVLALAGIFVAAVVKEHSTASSSPAFGATSQRLESVESKRYDYWRVALGSFGRHPLWGRGSAGFQVDWLRHRKVPDPAKDAHSLYIETAAELGLVGLVALGLFLGGGGLAARRAFAARPGLVAGWIAAALAWAVHAGLDWDWEMPAVTGVALLLGGALLAWSDTTSDEPGRVDAATPAATPATTHAAV